MKKARCRVKSLSPVAFCKAVHVEKESNETNDAYEKRTWRERAHYDQNGNMYIPSNMFKKSMAAAAQFLNRKIQGQGNSTYTKHFKAGIGVENIIDLSTKVEDVHGDWQFVPSDGKANSSAGKVHKCFPEVESWEGELEVLILDPVINDEIFEEVLKAAGMFIGVGRYRPINGGDKGRFRVESVEFEDAL
jgi:hypothetical protein